MGSLIGASYSRPAEYLQSKAYESSQVHQSLGHRHTMQVLAAAREQELQERAVYARAILEHFDRKVNDPENPQSPLMHFLDGLLRVLHTPTG